MAPRVLISDKLSQAAVEIFKNRGLEVDFQPDLGKDKDALLAVIGKYDGLAIRSATKVTQKIIDAAVQLHGGDGVRKGHIVESLYREIRALRIYEGASDVQKVVIARQAAGGGK